MNYNLLIEIVENLKEFELSKPESERQTMAAFTQWLNEKRYLSELPTDPGHSVIIGTDDVEIEIGKLVIFLNRYAKLLIKKGMAGFPDLVNEDFTYLYILMTAESMTKTELIEKNIHEKPTGLEVIKRLLKYGLIDERNDENDKRSKRVFLTEKGKSIFYATLDHMGKVSHLVSGTLTIAEKKQLYQLLKKLEDFHNPLFLNQRSASLDELTKEIH